MGVKIIAGNSTSRNWWDSASYDSFEVKQTLVLRMMFSIESHQLLVAANRYNNLKAGYIND
jgi:hypothetical protein